MQLRVLYFLGGEAVFMLIVVLCMLLCIIFGTMMYASPLHRPGKYTPAAHPH
jgi:hypothetical protein